MANILYPLNPYTSLMNTTIIIIIIIIIIIKEESI